ncbi:hypothetical protein FJ657_01715 [Schumannella soli]|uniref:Uncharacterized protein n=2 Tax=Schumannella soli TaxID=2590779 RepID=A0A506YAD2_9MICO|nr:hypothetical protein FJ657_01715 [Schumannella soli]
MDTFDPPIRPADRHPSGPPDLVIPPDPPIPFDSPGIAADPAGLRIPIDPDPDAIDRFFELLEIELGRELDPAPF